MTRAILILLALGCVRPVPPPNPNPPPPDPIVDAGVTEEETDASDKGRPCLAVCRNLLKLGCPAAKPTPEGASCTKVCENTLDSPIKWDLECRRTAVSCEAADRCQ